MKSFCNSASREVFLHILASWDDPVARANEWVEMHGSEAAAADALGAQLCKDVCDEYQWPEDDGLGIFLVRQGLRRVSWGQIAERLLERANVPAEKPSEDDAGEEGAGAA